MAKKTIPWADMAKASELLGLVDVPEGVSNAWKVQRFEITPDAAKLENMRMAWHGQGNRWIEAGQYTRLTYNGSVVMSDTRAELDDHREAVAAAEGRCLIAGLGLGVVLQAVMQKPEVTHVTVVEKSPDVIALVAPHYLARFGGRVSIVESDIFEFQPPKRWPYGMCWFDIWKDICGDNLAEMDRLHRRYARRAAWYGSWCHAEARRSQRNSW